MAKLILPTLASGFLDVDSLNSAFREIEAFAETVLSRDGVLPNGMTADLDLNGYRLLNIEPAVLAGQAATLGQVQETVAAAGSGIVIQGQENSVATAAQTVINLSTVTYTPGAKNVAVYINGVRKFVGLDFAETSPTSITMLSPLTLSDDITVVTNEYLGTVTPPVVNITWSSIAPGTIPEFASRWPDWTEVSGKPATFTPAAHVHATTDITSGVSFVDNKRGVFVQAGTPTATRIGDLWFF